MRTLLCMASLMVLSACSTIPEKLQLDESTNIVAFTEMKNKVGTSIGQTARWGGIIAKVENQAKRTMVEVVSFELSSSAKPQQKNETAGRFRLYFSGLLDPIIYKEGKSITAVGTISPLEEGKIGEHEYQFPVLNATNVHLWKNIQQVDVSIVALPFGYSPHYRGFPINRHAGHYVKRRSHQQTNKRSTSDKSSRSSNQTSSSVTNKHSSSNER
jgi:outer membrane lipoprotein